MDGFFIFGLITASAAIVGCAWLCWQLLRQNGRMLLRVEELEKRLDQLEFGVPQELAGSPLGSTTPGLELPETGKGEAGMDQGPAGEAGSALSNLEEQQRADRFGNRSLARSKIKRDGLKAGTPAPDFRLPRLDGRGELSLSDLRGRHVVVVFSSPCCEPCNELAPQLERFHRNQPDPELVMISRGEPGENRAKVKQHRLTFPVALQQGWAISRLYAIFATPAAYLIDQNGVIAHDVAVGGQPILQLLASITTAEE
jgi:peroxiredoxin